MSLCSSGADRPTRRELSVSDYLAYDSKNT